MYPSFYRVLTKYKLSIATGLLIGTAILYAPILNAAPIYKIVDSQTGQVTFTDDPKSYEQQAGKQISQTGITTESSNSPAANRANQASNDQTSSSQNNSAGTTLNAQSITNLPELTSPVRAVNYQLAMVEPSEERAYRRPAQSIVVQAQLKPALQVDDSASIYLDGDFVASGLSASIATVDIMPGKHSVQVVIKNKRGQIVQQVSRTVYVIQNTARLQQNKKIAEQLLAYERLPWYQKVLLKMRQEGITPNIESFTKPVVNTPMTLEQPVIK